MRPAPHGARWLACASLLLALATFPAALVGAQPLSSDEVVVRIRGLDPARLPELAERIDVWTERVRPGGDVVARVRVDELEALRRSGVTVEVDDVLTARYRQPLESLPGQVSAIPGFPCYRTVTETYAAMAAIAAAHPNLAAWNDIGDSWEKLNGGPGDDIGALVLGNQTLPGPKAPFVMIAAMHAREYTTAELATRFAESLVNGYGVDADATWILDHVQLHIIPHLNPDGRRRAETGLLWRKNVDNNYCSNTNDRGADLNRNSTYFWGGTGSSGSQCSETYRGPAPVSEPETGTIEPYLASVFPDQRGTGLNDPAPPTTTGVFLSLHSFGELDLFPWEGITNGPPNFAQLQTLGRKLGYFNRYTVCQTCYPATAGTTVDDAYGVLGVAAYTIELGTDFFEPCGSFQNNVLPDNLPALLYAVKAARRPYQDPMGPDAINLALSASPVPQGTTVTLTATADDTRYFSNGQGNEPTQPVAAAQYTIDQAPWETAGVAMAPADGNFNTPVEAVTGSIDTSGLSVGRHLVYVTATDSAGHTGVPTAIFLDVTPPAASADVSVSQADAPDPVLAGSNLTYTVTVGNAGPSPATGVVLTDTLPAGTAFVSSSPPSPTCTTAGGTMSCGLGTLASGASVPVTLVVQTALAGTIANTAVVAATEPDPGAVNNSDTETTTVVTDPVAELVHGSDRREDLAALPGPTPDTDSFRILQRPRSSYEVVVDSTSGDIGAAGPSLDLVASDGVTVLVPSSPIGAGSSRSLRFENATAGSIANQTVRVRSAGCQADCGTSSVYRIRSFETTAFVPRFNNSATQATILVLQNAGDAPLSGHVWLWDTSGALLGSQPFALESKATFILATSPLAPGASGSISVSHDGRRGDLVGKAVSVEPATGFTFDTRLEPRPGP